MLDAGAASGWHTLIFEPFLPTASLELCSATTRLHFCKVMSSSDNDFSIRGGAGDPDIALWGRGKELAVAQQLLSHLHKQPSQPGQDWGQGWAGIGELSTLGAGLPQGLSARGVG